jgi:hypothetical protein
MCVSFLFFFVYFFSLYGLLPSFLLKKNSYDDEGGQSALGSAMAGDAYVGATLMYDDPSDGAAAGVHVGAAVNVGAAVSVGAAMATQLYDAASATFMEESAGDTTQPLSLAYPSEAGVSPEAPFGGASCVMGIRFFFFIHICFLFILKLFYFVYFVP